MLSVNCHSPKDYQYFAVKNFKMYENQSFRQFYFLFFPKLLNSLLKKPSEWCSP